MARAGRGGESVFYGDGAGWESEKGLGAGDAGQHMLCSVPRTVPVGMVKMADCMLCALYSNENFLK